MCILLVFFLTTSFFCVIMKTVSAKNPERTYAAAESLAYYAKELVTPAYVEQTIKSYDSFI